MTVLADTTWDFGDFILAMLSIFFFVIWIWLLIMVFSDVFRRHDIGGGVKTLWVLFVLFFPYFGAFIYLISQGRGMGQRAQEAQAAAVDQMKQQMGYSVADELQKLDALHKQGALSDDEYQQARAKALG
jgi:phospholipase D-like protein/putative oligomerization/nucleic acid binding protein